jgi:hypothetical protein
MRRFSGQDSIDPDDPELDYSPLSLSERALKLGPSASQAARSERISVVPLSRPTSIAPKVINEPAKRSHDSDRRAAMLSVATRAASIASAAAIVALLFFIMKPAPLQSISSSTPSETTGSTPQSNHGNVESMPALAESKVLPTSLPSEPVTQEQSEQLLQRFLQSSSIRSDTTESKNEDEKSNPTLAQLKTLLASSRSDPATQERPQQLLQRFLQWSEEVDTTQAPASPTKRR